MKFKAYFLVDIFALFIAHFLIVSWEEKDGASHLQVPLKVYLEEEQLTTMKVHWQGGLLVHTEVELIMHLKVFLKVIFMMDLIL